jgi:hypothetical protein
MSKKLVQILVLCATFLVGGWLSYRYFAPSSRPVEQSSVLLEKIQAVAKLVTVEGQFTEIYNYSEYQGYFTFFWDKKVLVRVRATVSAGYDLEKMQVTADSLTRTIRVTMPGEPQIIAVDHTLDYYDISEGLFTSFSAEDYNRINARAKDLIREQALKSNLMVTAKEQGNKILDLMRFMTESAGWKMEIITPQPPKNPG